VGWAERTKKMAGDGEVGVGGAAASSGGVGPGLDGSASWSWATGGDAGVGEGAARTMKRVSRRRSSRSNAGRNSFGKRMCNVRRRFSVSGETSSSGLEREWFREWSGAGIDESRLVMNVLEPPGWNWVSAMSLC
jgi:hypothetical protein